MEHTAHHSWFSEHSGWEDFCSALFGGLIGTVNLKADRSD